MVLERVAIADSLLLRRVDRQEIYYQDFLYVSYESSNPNGPSGGLSPILKSGRGGCIDPLLIICPKL